MGYYTYNNLSVKTTNSTPSTYNFDEMMTDMHNTIPYCSCYFDKKGHSNDLSKAYDLPEQIKNFSTKYPYLIFTLKVDGEDMAHALYFIHQGKMQMSIGRLVFDEMDFDKMV